MRFSPKRTIVKIVARQRRKLEAKKARLPHDIAVIAETHFKKSFKNQGFTDRSFTSWAEVNRRKPNHKQFQKKRQQAILTGMQSGGLGKTINIKQSTFRRIVIASSGKKYAKFHNDGTGRLPKRQFMGNSVIMERKMKREFDRQYKKALRP